MIIHKEKLNLLPSLVENLQEKETEIRLDPEIFKQMKLKDVGIATIDDWHTEYLDNILSIKLVNDIDEAIKHIQMYGTHHSEAIITEDNMAADKFFNQVDASCVLKNASTRFNDGGQLVRCRAWHLNH